MPSLDMSELLTADKVLLIGEFKSPDLGFVLGHQVAFFRQSLPITLTERSLRWRRERSELQYGDALDETTRPEFQRDPSMERR
jgi:hypothetical protein